MITIGADTPQPGLPGGSLITPEAQQEMQDSGANGGNAVPWYRYAGQEQDVAPGTELEADLPEVGRDESSALEIDPGRSSGGFITEGQKEDDTDFLFPDEEEGPTSVATRSPAEEESWAARYKTELITGGVALAAVTALYLLLRKKDD